MQSNKPNKFLKRVIAILEQLGPETELRIRLGGSKNENLIFQLSNLKSHYAKERGICVLELNNSNFDVGICTLDNLEPLYNANGPINRP